jgi:hypothetical protein
MVLSMVSDASLLDVIADTVLPSVTLVASVLIAVLLFRAERKDAKAAREQERQDRVLEGIIESFAFFVSVNPLTEDWSSEFRKLRAQVMILQTLASPKATLLGDWLALECEHGTREFAAALAKLDRIDTLSVDVFIEIMEPAHSWAHGVMNAIGSWMRGGIPDEKVLAKISELKAMAARPD